MAVCEHKVCQVQKSFLYVFYVLGGGCRLTFTDRVHPNNPPDVFLSQCLTQMTNTALYCSCSLTLYQYLDLNVKPIDQNSPPECTQNLSTYVVKFRKTGFVTQFTQPLGNVLVDGIWKLLHSNNTILTFSSFSS